MPKSKRGYSGYKGKKPSSSHLHQPSQQSPQAENRRKKNQIIELETNLSAERKYFDYLSRHLNIEGALGLGVLSNIIVTEGLLPEEPIFAQFIMGQLAQYLNLDSQKISSLTKEGLMSVEWRCRLPGASAITVLTGMTIFLPLLNGLLPSGFLKYLLKFWVDGEETPANEEELRSTVERLQEINKKIFGLYMNLASAAIVTAPYIYFNLIRTAAFDREASSGDLLFSRILRDVAMMFTGFFLIQNRLKYNQNLLKYKNTHFLNNLKELTEPFGISWDTVGQIDKHNGYFKLELSPQKEWDFQVSRQNYTLLRKTVIADISYVLTKKLGAEILASNSTTLLVKSSSNEENESGLEQVNKAKGLLEKRLVKHVELQADLPHKLTQLNKMAKILGYNGWWSYEKTTDEGLPEIQFGLFCMNEEERNKLVKHLTELGCQVETKYEQILVTGSEPIDENRLAESVNQLNLTFKAKTAIEPVIEQQSATIEEEGSSSSRIKEKTRGVADKENRWYKNIFTLFSTKELRETQEPCCSNVKWNKEKYRRAYNQDTKNFVQLKNCSNKFFAYFDPKLDKKLGDNAEGFRSIFYEANFIGQGYVENKAGHILKKKGGGFKIKKMGAGGGYRVEGEIKALGPEGEMLIHYSKTSLH
jgi:hypothetical protein